MNNNKNISSEPSATVNTAELMIVLGLKESSTRNYCRDIGVKPVGRMCPGGKVYSLYEFPKEVQRKIRDRRGLQKTNAIARQHIASKSDGAAAAIVEKLDAAASDAAREQSGAAMIALPPRAQTRIEMKSAILNLWQSFHAARGGALASAHEAFIHAWRNGKIAAEPALRERFPKLSVATLNRWPKLIAKRGAKALCGGYGNRTGSSHIDSQPLLRAWLTGFIFEHPHAKAARVMEGLTAAFREAREIIDTETGEIIAQDPVELPKLRALQLWLKKYRRACHAELAKAANPDGFRSKYGAAFGSRSQHVVRLNQLWEIDASPADVMLTDGRHAIILVIDVYSRRVKILVSKTSTAVAVGLLLRRAILEWGIPEAVKSDNGKDFTAKSIELVLLNLGIEQLLCPPFSPDHKPHVERGIQTFQHGVLELCPGFVGHSVAEAQGIRARKSFAERQGGADAVKVTISAARLQEICDKWCDAVYARRVHGGLNGRTPFEVATAWTLPVRRIENQRALDLLLAPMPDGGRTRVVGKKGIRLGNFTYGAGELGAYVKDTVIPLHDPDGDAGRLIVYAENGDFICIAECPELTGTSRAEIAAKMKARQNEFIAEGVNDAKAKAKQFRNADLIKLILDDAVAQAANVVALPMRAVAHETPALAEAARAAAALDRHAPQAAPDTPEIAAEHARLVDEMRVQKVVAFPIEQDDWSPIRRCRGIQQRIAAGVAVSDADREWLASYTQTADYRTFSMLADEFPQKLEERRSS